MAISKSPSFSALGASVAACTAALVLVGCASNPAPAAHLHMPTYEAAQSNPFVAHAQQAVSALLQGVDISSLGQAPVLVATVVDVNELKQAKPLGRTLGELYASQLSRQGLNVKEMKLRGDVYIRQSTGELLLSREIHEIASQHNAALVLVGTYSAAAQYTFVSMKLVRTADSRIISSHDYALPNDRDVQRLLK
ncbi:MAG: hypothetical protein KIG95_12400 [Comamonas sp.]|nr:hypothetical protein [Comamonas sp.]